MTLKLCNAVGEEVSCTSSRMGRGQALVGARRCVLRGTANSMNGDNPGINWHPIHRRYRNTPSLFMQQNPDKFRPIEPL